MFKLQQRYLTELPKDGQQVVCKGRISVYEPRGDYQLIVDTIDFHGKGSLQANYEQLKANLASEGLFDLSHKKQLPDFPNHITLVTSPNGAAVHDFVKIATRRFPPIDILVYPVAVQGEQASREMIDSIRHINQLKSTDIIVLCRGGGSIEDLWAYNDEQLARDIYDSDIPVVSAVGHEIDFTIADLAADLRAPTPSSAAEILIPDKKAIIHKIASAKSTLIQSLHRTITEKENQLHINKQMLGYTPQPIDSFLLKIDRLSMRLEFSILDTLEHHRTKIEQLNTRIERNNPASTLLLQQEQFQNVCRRFHFSSRALLESKENKLQKTISLLDAVSPLATMARGYSIVRKKDTRNTVITHVGQVKSGEKIDILVQDGSINCSVDTAKPVKN